MSARGSSIWRSLKTLEELNTAGERTLIRHLDIVFTEIGADFVSATMPVDARTHQPYGLLHGGASVVLAETLGSTGAGLCVDHVRSVKTGRVTGTARPVHLGARTQVWTIDIVNEAHELVCISRLTVAVVKTRLPGA
jgi:1,4-dihydroxy-2-naphthoyl-CoA hydrolase